MKKTMLFLLLAVFTVFSAKANPVDVNVARNVGAKFLSANTKVQLRGNDLQLAKTYNITRGDAAFYVFNAPNGFVIVAGDDCAYPILGYSDNGRPFDPNNVPIQLQDVLQEYVEQIQYAVENRLVADEKTAEQWRMVKATGKLSNNRDNEQVGPLLTTTWDQGQYYNAMCPEDENGPDGHCVTGCVATAMAQIIKYWGYPVSGRGIHTYQSNYGELSVNFAESNYDYANMPDALTSNSSQEEVNAVAKLMYDCGVAVNMGYDAAESGTWSYDIRGALVNNFDFSPTINYSERNLMTDCDWLLIVKRQILDEKPILYGGTGVVGSHMFVCDGYKNPDDYFHFNFGWSGNFDGWYQLSAINPTDGYEFNWYQSAYIDIIPNENNTSTTLYAQFSCEPHEHDCITVIKPIDIYNTMAGNDYLFGNYATYSEGHTFTFIPSDETKQIALFVMDDVGLNCSFYDGITTDILIRSFESMGGQYYYHIDTSPIISTQHALTVRIDENVLLRGFHYLITEYNGCDIVTGFVASSDTSKICLSWNDNSECNTWQIEYGPAGFIHNEGTFLSVDTNNAIIDGLPTLEYYDFYVRQVCGDDLYGPWSKPIKTAVMPPYWIDIVTTQPEGYVVDADGNVEISTAEGLVWLARITNSKYVTEPENFEGRTVTLTSDIDLGGYLWCPINTFNGIFDGGGFYIDNLMSIADGFQDIGGLILSLNNGIVKNVMITNSIINEIFDTCIGGIAGIATNSSIYNCFFDGEIIGNDVGGIVGSAQYSEIVNCVAYGAVKAKGYSGGISAYLNCGRMLNCYSSVILTPKYLSKVGGICCNCVQSEISNCYANIYKSSNFSICNNLVEANLEDNSYYGEIDDEWVLIELTFEGLVYYSIPFEDGYHSNLLEIMNKGVEKYNLQGLKLWVADANGSYDGLPVLSNEDYIVECPNVLDLSLRNISKGDSLGLEVSWKDETDAEYYEVKYGKLIYMGLHMMDTILYTNLYSNPDTIWGLEEGFHYLIRIRPICDEIHHGAWSDEASIVFDKPYWTDYVTTKPEGYYVDNNGNVEISTAEGLAWLISVVNGKNGQIANNMEGKIVTLYNDIDIGAYKWESIVGFSGIFNGNNHVIENLYVNENKDYQGFFGTMDNAVAMNIRFEHPIVVGHNYVGTVCGYGTMVSLSNIHVVDCDIEAFENAGGMIGYVIGQYYVYGCGVTGWVSAELNYAGGVVGEAYNGEIRNSYSNCTVMTCWVGGLFVGVGDYTFVDNCCVNGELSTMVYGGGIFGSSYRNYMRNCYTTFNVPNNEPGYIIVGEQHPICILSGGNGSYISVENTYFPQGSIVPIIAGENITIIDTASFYTDNNIVLFTSPITISGVQYTDLLSALNAWVDANNTNGEYLQWVADTNNENGGFPMLERMPATTAQISSFTEGWNWYSTYIEQDKDGLEMLENSLGHQGLTIKSYNDFTTNYYNDLGYDYWFGGLENLENEACYMIQTSSASSIVMTGRPAIPSEHPITIKPNWNWIGYPVANEHLASSAMGSFQPSNEDILKNHSDFATYYEGYGWFHEDFVMTPGKGYMYMSNANANKTLTYSASREELPEFTEQEHQWTPEVHKYADNMSVIAVVNLDGDEIRDGIEVGAFVNGECRGSAIMRYFEPTDRYYAMLSIVGEDGDIVNFRIIDDDSETQVAFNKNAVLGSLDDPYNLEFLSNRHEVSTLELFPNPVERSNEIEIIVPKYENTVSVLIINALGEIVRNEPFNGGHVSVPGQPGVYMVRINCDNGKVYYSKLIIK